MCIIVEKSEKIFPGFQVANYGESVYFTCWSTVVKIKWKFKSVTLPIDKIPNTQLENYENKSFVISRLSISNITEVNYGNYSCQMEEKDNLIFEASATLTFPSK